MDGYLLSAFLVLIVLYVMLALGRGREGFFANEAAVAEYKQKVMLMFAKYGKGQPIDIGKMDAELLTDMFKDFLIAFNEFQAKVGGKPVGQSDIQTVFPLDFLNEYNATVSKP